MKCTIPLFCLAFGAALISCLPSQLIADDPSPPINSEDQEDSSEQESSKYSPFAGN